ncbi:SPW repeat protein [Streptomyces sp. NPDC048664]|uniref:SPW repeat protein n=1 Tax=Streptomyces sp. NPDC048664 TaxID=3154505 RepID=UPI003448E3C5
MLPLDGLVLLVGVYAAISPWVIHFAGTNPYLTANNVIVGLAVTVLAFGVPLMPSRMNHLSWTMLPMGLWLIIAPSLVTASHDVSTAIVWNNSCTGGVLILSGLITTTLGLGTLG